MRACNLAKMVHNKWLQQYGNKIICLYKVRVDDIVRDFMHFFKNKYILDWPIVPSTWPMKIGTNLLREEVLVLEDDKSRLHRRRHFCCVIGFRRLWHSQSLGCIFVHCQTQMSTQLSYSWKQCGANQHHQQRITKTNGEHQIHGWIVCCWSHYQSIPMIYCYH